MPAIVSDWSVSWSEPKRHRTAPKLVIAAARQQVLAAPIRFIPTPNVTATLSAISDPGVSTALVTALIFNEVPTVPPDLTSVNVVVTEAEDGGVSASVRED